MKIKSKECSCFTGWHIREIELEGVFDREDFPLTCITQQI